MSAAAENLPLPSVAVVSADERLLRLVVEALRDDAGASASGVAPGQAPPASALIAVVDARLPAGASIVAAYHAAGCLVLVAAEPLSDRVFAELHAAGADDWLELPMPVEAARRRLTLVLRRARRARANGPRPHEQWFAQFMRHLPGVAFIKDADSRCIYFNETFGRIFRAKLEDWYLTNDEDHWPPEIVAKFKKNDRHVIETGSVLSSIEFAPHADGIHAYASSKFPIRDENGTPIMVGGIGIDITEQRRNEEIASHAVELARSNAELEQFAHACSHDLREPLRMVTSFLNLLKRRLGPGIDEKAADFLHQAMDGGMRMQEMINGLLAYACVGGAPPSCPPVDAGKAVGTARLNLHQVIAETGARIEAGELPAVAVDESQLVQLFQNLIGNALKFCRDRAPVVLIAARPIDGGAYEFSVRDNGIGIASDGYERIFEVFQRLHTRAEYPGTGLGLAICRKIVERVGGRIRVESEPGEGSVFIFTLPTTPPIPAGAGPASDAPLVKREPA